MDEQIEIKGNLSDIEIEEKEDIGKAIDIFSEMLGFIFNNSENVIYASFSIYEKKVKKD